MSTVSVDELAIYFHYLPQLRSGRDLNPNLFIRALCQVLDQHTSQLSSFRTCKLAFPSVTNRPFRKLEDQVRKEVHRYMPLTHSASELQVESFSDDPGENGQRDEPEDDVQEGYPHYSDDMALDKLRRVV